MNKGKKVVNATFFIEYRKSVPNSLPKIPMGTSKYVYACERCEERMRLSEKYCVLRSVHLSRGLRRNSGMPKTCQNPGCGAT